MGTGEIEKRSRPKACGKAVKLDWLHQEGDRLMKDDDMKPRPSLVICNMPRAIQAVVDVSDFEAKKYTPDGWLRVPNGIERYTDAMLRHLLAESMSREDEDSSLLHAAHTAWNSLARLELMLLESER